MNLIRVGHAVMLTNGGMPWSREPGGLGAAINSVWQKMRTNGGQGDGVLTITESGMMDVVFGQSRAAFQKWLAACLGNRLQIGQEMSDLMVDMDEIITQGPKNWLAQLEYELTHFFNNRQPYPSPKNA
jgi:hypothetical protein